MNKETVLFALVETVDFLLQLAPLMLILLWLGNAIYTVVAVNVFTRSPVWIIFKTINIHAVTMLSLTTFYLYTFYHLNYLLPHVRVPVTIGFTVLGAVYYDFVWSIFDLLASGRGVPLGPFALSLGTYAILWFYDGKHRFLKLKPRFYVLQIMFLSSVTILALTGFYQTLHAGIDPHPGNWLWALSKFTGVWAWSGTYFKRGGLE